jgi:hypothetical protein
MLFASPLLAACAPQARIPSLPQSVPGALAEEHPDAARARSLAPLLYLQRDEPFRLERIVAVVHPRRPIIGYHFLWQDDAHGAWLPFTSPTDQEVVWVGYDSLGAPTDVWTYWHSSIVHADWRHRGAVSIDVQWGKHGSLPRGTRPDELPVTRSLDAYYLLSWMLPDLWLGALARGGPACFCHGFARYLEFTEPVPIDSRIAAVVRLEDPVGALRAVFGDKYSEKHPWPW